MQVTAPQIWSALELIREQAPVIHNITNFVVMNNTANALLAIGASPVMAHAEEEMEEMVGIAGALVINIGTLSRHWIPSMLRAVYHARERNIPIILDPVGAGATSYRTRTCREILDTAPITIIRGNASEIMALVNSSVTTKGVDSSALSDDALDAAQRLHDRYGSVVCVSGETDYILAGADCANVTKVLNGHILMTKVTGLGCTASALCGAFAAIQGNAALAAVEAMAVMGIAGEMGAMKSFGPGSMQVNFLDALYRLTEENINKYLKIEG